MLRKRIGNIVANYLKANCLGISRLRRGHMADFTASVQAKYARTVYFGA
ncbi:hypothetical protein [Undibacterium sp. TJN19]